MTRACASCGLHFCDGIECYLADPADYPEPIEEVVAQVAGERDARAKAFWERLTAERADLQPKKRPDGRWEIAA